MKSLGSPKRTGSYGKKTSNGGLHWRRYEAGRTACSGATTTEDIAKSSKLLQRRLGAALTDVKVLRKEVSKMADSEFYSIVKNIALEQAKENLGIMAEMLKMFYDSLVSQGFSSEQAMELVVNYHSLMLSAPIEFHDTDEF